MTDYYFDYDNGDDSNTAPYSASNALKNLCGTPQATSNAVFNPSAGDNLYLARGSTWNVSTNWTFNASDVGADGNPITIDAYDRTGESGQSDPIVEFFQIFSTGDWTADGTYTDVYWAALPVGSTGVKRTFFDMSGQKSGATSIATCNSVTPWWFDNGNDRLYVYTGSATLNPNEVYSDVRCTCGPAQYWGLFISRTAYLRFNNINFRGSNNSLVGVSNTLLATDCGDIQFDSCKLEYCGSYAMQWLTTVDQAFIGTNIVSNCLIYKRWSTNENIGTGNPGGDGIYVDGGPEYNLDIYNNTIVDFGHSGINLNADTAGNREIKGVRVYDNDISAPLSEYCRGISCNGRVASKELIDTLICRNYIHDTCVQNQISGRNTRFVSNIIDTVRECPTAANVAYGVSTAANSTNDVDNVVIANNTLLNIENIGIRITDSVGKAVVSYSCYNNIVIKSAGEIDNYCFTYVENDAKGTLNVRNNAFVSDYTTDVISWDSTDYTISTAEAALTEMSGNLSNDPLLDDSYKPSKDSAVYHSGIFAGWNSDYNGRPFNVPPTIGAYEFTSGFPAQTRLTSSARTITSTVRTVRT